jgi:hypothetical protein
MFAICDISGERLSDFVCSLINGTETKEQL